MSSVKNIPKGIAVITGASSGIGRDIAIILNKMGYETVLASRNVEKLNELAGTLPNNSYVMKVDLSDRNECAEFYHRVSSLEKPVDILINNAGFGLFGKYNETNINTELKMIDTNVVAVQILSKLFLNDFVKNDYGYILNVASSAGFMPGPLMAVYYSTKAFVLRLTESVSYELKKDKSKVYFGALCPGPVDTEFNNTAKVKFALNGLKSIDVAQYAVSKMFAKKTVIVPGTAMKLGKFGLRFLPDTLAAKIGYNIQSKKG